jgi:hypothetical protein
MVDSPRNPCDAAMMSSRMDGIEVDASTEGRYAVALSGNDEFVEFLTLPAYERLEPPR